MFPISPTSYSRGALYAQFSFVLLAVLWGIWYHLRLPGAPIGLAIAVLAFAAVVMTVRAEHNWTKTEQVLWIVIAFALLYIESRSLFQAQVEFETQRQQAADIQQSQFGWVAHT
jgi:hypothetical protein